MKKKLLIKRGKGPDTDSASPPVRPVRKKSLLHGLTPLLWALLAVTVAVVGAGAIVRSQKKPGQMTVLEGMNMDTGAMASGPGMTPVAVESVRLAPFSSKVTYTGSILPYTEQNVLPRAEGYLRDFTVYPGDSVRAGQLLVRLDAPDLSRKVAEAEFGSVAAKRDIAVSNAEVVRLGRDRQAMLADVTQLEKERQAAEAELSAAQSEAEGAKSQRRAAQRAIQEARNMLQVKQAAVQQASRQVAMAQAARWGMEKTVNSAWANLTYWEAEIRRVKALQEQGAASVQELQSEQAQHDAAVAAHEEAQAKVDEARANVEAAQANVTQMQADVSAAQSRIEQAEANAEAADAAVSNREAMVRAARLKIERAAAGVEVGRRKVDAAQAMIDKGVSEVGQRQAMANRSQSEVATARTFQQFGNVIAPFSGQVTKRLVSPGTLVGPTTPILTIAQLDRVRLQANVAESDLGSIRVGAAVRAYTTGANRQWVSARVTSVFPQADAMSRTAVVEAVVANPGYRLIPGKYVVLEINTSAEREQLTVPSRAVVSRDGQSYVWVAVPQKDGMLTSSLRKVSLGPTDGQRTTVSAGLRPGDQVIYAGQEGLQEGTMVTPTAWTDTGPKELPKPMPGQGMPGMPGMPGMKAGDSMEGMPGMKSGGAMESMPGMEHPASPRSPAEHRPEGTRPGGSMPGMNMPGMDMGGGNPHSGHGGN